MGYQVEVADLEEKFHCLPRALLNWGEVWSVGEWMGLWWACMAASCMAA